MSKQRIYLSPPHQTGDEIIAIQKAMTSNWLAPVGPQLDDFEQAISEATGYKYAVATSSGTAALHLGLIILGVSAGDFVLTSDLTFVGAVNPIVYQNATPVFVDSDPDSWNISAKQAENFLARDPRPIKAMIPTHLYGMPADVINLEKLGRQYQVPVLHDLAECLAGQVDGSLIGEITTRGILSFNGNKLITTSGGGAFLTNIKEEADLALYLATQAKSKTHEYHHERVGYNYRLSNVLAALGIAQIRHLKERTKKKQVIFETYRSELSPLGFIFQKENEGRTSDRWLTCALLPDGIDLRIEELVEKMDRFNIEIRPLWKPMHQQPIYAEHEVLGGNVSEQLFTNGFCLPSGCGLTAQQQIEVIKRLKSVVFGD